MCVGAPTAPAFVLASMADNCNVNVRCLLHLAKMTETLALVLGLVFVPAADSDALGVGIDDNEPDLRAKPFLGLTDSREDNIDAARGHEVDYLKLASGRAVGVG